MSVIERALGRNKATDGARLNLGLDDLCHLLSNSRRRFVIAYVGSLDEEESVSLNDLARGIAWAENDDCPDVESVNSRQKKRVYISLYQGHLGKLDDAGLVRWDDQSQSVSPTADTATVCEIVHRMNVMLSEEGTV